MTSATVGAIDIVAWFVYLFSAVLFVVGLHFMNSPKTARKGNQISAFGMVVAVLMVVGNAPVIPDSIASPISTLTSQIALDMSYSSGLHRSALFGMGVVLFIISATLVGIVRLISKKKRG